MTASGEIVEALGDVIARQFEVAQSLLATLEQERAALASLDTEAVDAAGTTKLGQLGEMEALENERATLIEMHDLEPRTFMSVDSDGELTAAWQGLLQLLTRCQLLNESNGALVASQRRHVQEALTLLYGGAPEDVYGPDGMTRNRGQATTIATA